MKFDILVAEFGACPGVRVPGEDGRRGFGSSALKVNGSIFAMLTRDQLVVKLPRGRVETLIQNGTGASFDAGKGRPMKEWLTLLADDVETWVAVAKEAMEFVRSRRP